MSAPIVIPTKGRPGGVTTVGVLEKEGVGYFLLVEPAEEAAYRSAYPDARMLVLPESDRGLGFSRRWVCDYFASIGDKKVWQVDDDLASFVRFEEKPVLIGARTFFEEIEGQVQKHEHIANVGGVYVQAMRDKSVSEVTWNRHIGTCFLCDTSAASRFDASFVVRQDLQFNLANILGGWRTMRFNRLGFRCAVLGKNEGGCRPWYVDGSSLRMAQRIVSRWPALCTLSSKDTPDQRVRVDWKRVDREVLRRSVSAC